MKIGRVLPISCFDERRGLPAIASKSIDHIITDPPYEKHVHADNRRSQRAGGKIVTPDMGFSHLTEEERVACAAEFVRICRGWILVFCAIEGARPWQDLLVEAGAKRRNTMLWIKTNAAPKFAGDGPAAAAEAIVAAWAGQGRSVWNAGGAHGTYSFMAERKDRRHPTQKPLDLMRQIVADFTQPGQLILDPYAGSGQTLIAAQEQGRRWAGFEMAHAHAGTAEIWARNAKPHFTAPRRPKNKPRLRVVSPVPETGLRAAV